MKQFVGENKFCLYIIKDMLLRVNELVHTFTVAQPSRRAIVEQ